MKVVIATCVWKCDTCNCFIVPGAHAIERKVTSDPHLIKYSVLDCVVCALRAIHEPVDFEAPDPNWHLTDPSTEVMSAQHAVGFIRKFAEACDKAFQDGEPFSLVGERLRAPVEAFLRIEPAKEHPLKLVFTTHTPEQEASMREDILKAIEKMQPPPKSSA